MRRVDTPHTLCRVRSHFLDAIRRSLAPWCAVCGVERGDPVCPGCLADFLPEDVRRCGRCGNRLPASPDPAVENPVHDPVGNFPVLVDRHVEKSAGSGEKPVDIPGDFLVDHAVDLCGGCLAQRRRFDATVALADYAAPISGMIAALKFQGRLDLGYAFGRLLARRAARLSGPEFDALIPIPVAPQRLRGRGYNQAEEIARGIAAGLGSPVLARHLIRSRDGPAQHDLPLAQRRSGIRGAFALRMPLPGAIRCVAVVDDVMTSGATLDEAAAVLKRAGVERVVNLVAARTA